MSSDSTHTRTPRAVLLTHAVARRTPPLSSQRRGVGHDRLLRDRKKGPRGDAVERAAASGVGASQDHAVDPGE